MESFSTTKMQISGSKRNSPSMKQRYAQLILERTSKYKKKKKTEISLSIYAELSKKAYRSILNDEAEISLPYGIKMNNHKGSRGLFFECDNEDAKKALINGLDASGIMWQEN